MRAEAWAGHARRVLRRLPALPGTDAPPLSPPSPQPADVASLLALFFLLIQGVLLLRLLLAFKRLDPKTLYALCERSAAARRARADDEMPKRAQSGSRFSTHVLDATPLSSLLSEHRQAIQVLRDAFVEAGGEPDAHTDAWLLRFLAASDGHIPRAAAWVQRTTAWRIESGMACKRRRALEGHTMLEDAEVVRLLRYAPLLISHRTGAHGGPLSILHVGGFSPASWMAAQDTAQFVQAGHALLESCATVCDVASTATDRLIRQEILLDYSGLALRHLNPLVFLRLRPMITLPDRYYPEAVGHVLVVHAPALFTQVFRIISPWLSQDLRDRIQIVKPAASPDAIASFAPSTSLPAAYGGPHARMPPDVATGLGMQHVDADTRAALLPGDKLAGYAAA